MPAILGDKKFRQNVLSKPDTISGEVPYQISLRGSPALNQIIHVCADSFSMSTEAITVKKRGKSHEARNLAMFVARQEFGYKLQPIGNASLAVRMIEPTTERAVAQIRVYRINYVGDSVNI